MNPLTIPTIPGLRNARVTATPSKSVTHRALVAAALSRGTSEIVGPLDADDTRVTAEGLRSLGFGVELEPGRWRVSGGAGRVTGGGKIELRESGTSFRFLLALAALGERPTALDGAPRLRERPASELVDALAARGARIVAAGGDGRLPLEAGGAPPTGGAVRLPGHRSSQFVSALLLAGCAVEGGLDVTVDTPLVSRPYVDLTVDVMSSFGLDARVLAPDRWRVTRQAGEARVFAVEGDHSSASYFLAAAAVVEGEVRVDGLRGDSLQPDARLQSLLERLGCAVIRDETGVTVRSRGALPPFEIDLEEAPDLAPTVAVLALFAGGRSRITGVAHLRLKESDRLAVLASNINALGGSTAIDGDRLEIEGGRSLRGTLIDTAGDHRMAMAFAVAGLRVDGVVIDNPGCVAKSNPAFWDQLAALVDRSTR